MPINGCNVRADPPHFRCIQSASHAAQTCDTSATQPTIPTINRHRIITGSSNNAPGGRKQHIAGGVERRGNRRHPAAVSLEFATKRKCLSHVDVYSRIFKRVNTSTEHLDCCILDRAWSIRLTARPESIRVNFIRTGDTRVDHSSFHCFGGTQKGGDGADTDDIVPISFSRHRTWPSTGPSLMLGDPIRC